MLSVRQTKQRTWIFSGSFRTGLRSMCAEPNRYGAANELYVGIARFVRCTWRTARRCVPRDVSSLPEGSGGWHSSHGVVHSASASTEIYFYISFHCTYGIVKKTKGRLGNCDSSAQLTHVRLVILLKLNTLSQNGPPNTIALYSLKCRKRDYLVPCKELAD